MAITTKKQRQQRRNEALELISDGVLLIRRYSLKDLRI